MSEDFIQYLWKYKLFNPNLQTTQGEALSIEKAGQQNRDAGPDFINARLKIGKTKWAGNVEIHVNASDWYKHRHHTDQAYNNIILHVVQHDDKPVMRNNHENIPTLVIENQYNKTLHERYVDFMAATRWIACENMLHQINEIVLKSWSDRLVIERLERKTESISHELTKNKGNWEQSFYEKLSRNFGFGKNGDGFELLAKSFPFSCLAKHSDSLLAIESMLFGQAGLLLGGFHDDYPKKLKKEYTYYRSKFSLRPIHGHLWRFLRLRPSNFPTIRISQLAQLFFKAPRLFSNILDCNHFAQLNHLFQVQASGYWSSHYVFDKPSAFRPKKLGQASVHLLIINTVIPFLYLYGQMKKQEKYKDRALDFLSQIPAETNAIIQRWNAAGAYSQCALESQALIELYENYCASKRCLECRIGNGLIR